MWEWVGEREGGGYWLINLIQTLCVNFICFSIEKGWCDHICSTSPQGPLRNTCGHFWLMIWEQRTKAIIMLNRVIEKGSVSTHYKTIQMFHSICQTLLSLTSGFYQLREHSQTNRRYLRRRTYHTQVCERYWWMFCVEVINTQEPQTYSDVVSKSISGNMIISGYFFVHLYLWWNGVSDLCLQWLQGIGSNFCRLVAYANMHTSVLFAENNCAVVSVSLTNDTVFC